MNDVPQSPVEDRRKRAEQLAVLRPLAVRFPNIDAAMAEIARLAAVMTLPKGTVHVISDIHGEDRKLRHVINNASGSLRPLVERLFGTRLSPERLQEFLTLLFYPGEMIERLQSQHRTPPAQQVFALETLRQLFELVRVLSARYSLKRAMEVFPPEYRELLAEMLHTPTTERGQEFVAAIVQELVRLGSIWPLLHVTVRLIRNLAIYELIIAGDCWDRGPRGDRVVDYLRLQPNVSFIWGNHDVAWLGASLGHEALICHVLRVSLRYRRLSQIDQGYSIPWTPLEQLALKVYGDDPAERFRVKGAPGTRSPELEARMQKAAAIMQYKLEGQAIARHPEWALNHRRLLHRMNLATRTIEVDGVGYPLLDSHLPTLDPADPYALSAEEQTCLAKMRLSFLHSQKLAEHMRWLVGRGSMYLLRDDHLIFHGCVPVDAAGALLPMVLDGRPVRGRALFDAIEQLLVRVIGAPVEGDLDQLWYLWSGPLSPLFGKDRITTLERDFIADPASHHETKNPYFSLIHDAPFCDSILREFGADPARGLIVNGHVPVRIEKAESPLKRSGKAITIDGAFSEAYGDHGYTLVMESERTYLALHHHFSSVEAAIRDGVDIIPSVSVVRAWDHPRHMADTERGAQFRCESELLERLIQAYRRNELRQNPNADVPLLRAP
jgi:fructose-1,6-bisphosphatase-3